MPDTAMQALYPFATRILSEEDSQSDLLTFIQQHKQRVFFLPRAPFNSTEQLRPLVKAGARLLIRRTDVRKQLISAEQRDEWIITFGHQVFLQGYAPSSSIKFLKKGASILLDNQDLEGGLPANSVQDVCQHLQGTSKVKVNYFGFREDRVLDMLRYGIKLVFYCPPGSSCNLTLIDKCLTLQMPNLIVAASGYSSHLLTNCLHQKATVVITGQDRIPFRVIEQMALAQPSQPDPRQRRLKVFPDGDLQQHLIQLHQLAQDQYIELLDNDDWYFNTAP